MAAKIERGRATLALFRWLVPNLPEDAEAVVMPHDGKKE
jgi:hypothetical protein